MQHLSKTIKALLAAPLALGAAAGDSQAAPQYVLTDLGTLGGGHSSAGAVNEAGQVVGASHLQNNASLRAYLWQAGSGFTDLTTLGGSQAMATAINNSGLTVGNARIAGDSASRAFAWSSAGMSPLPGLGGNESRATSINDSAQIAGAASFQGDLAEHAVLWAGPGATAATDLGTLGGASSQASDVNAIGQVVGYAENANRATRAALWAPPYNGAQDLGTLGGGYSEAYAINAKGQVTGVTSNSGDTQLRGFLWQAGAGMTDIGTLTATSTETAGYDINGAGDLVGYSTTAGGAAKRAVIRKAGGTLADLNGLILPTTGFALTEARGINDAGQIVGMATFTVTEATTNTIRVEPHAFLLTPDKVLPSITCPANITTAGTQPASLGQAVASDNLDPAPVVSNNRPATFPNGTTTVTWTATDAAANKGSCSQTVTIAPPDTTPPVVAAVWTPATPDGLNGWYRSKPALLAWSITDLESAIGLKTGCVDSSVAADTAGSSFSCSATSGGGTSAVVTTTVKLDSTGPVVTPPAAASATLNGATSTVVSFAAPSATDALSGVDAASPACSPASGSPFNRGSTEVSCSATDLAGNSGTASFTVTVTDPSAPIITPVVTGTAGTNGWYRGPASISWTVVERESPETLAKTGCAGLTQATDSAGASDSCAASSAGGNAPALSRTLKVDATAPTITPPQAIVAEATGPAGAIVNWAAPVAGDALSGLTTAGVSCSPASGSSFALGTATVTCSASDQAGNAGTAGFGVTVRDTTAPKLTLPAAIATSTTNANGTAVTFSATASDLVSGTRPVVCLPASGAVFPIASTTVSCSASDTAGNTANGSFTVTVNQTATDTAPPALSLPDGIVATASNADGALVTYSATATDAVSGPRPVSCAPASGSLFPIGLTTVNCSATDAAGNTASGSFPVTMNAPAPVDTTPPALNLPGAIVTTATGADGALVSYTATAVDAVSGSRPVSCAPASGSLFPVGLTTVNCTASDAAGNTANGSFTVTVQSPAPTASVDVAVSGSVSNASPRKGDTVRYTFVVSNLGSGLAQGVTVTDVLPRALRFSTVSTTPTLNCTRPTNSGGGTLSCSVGTLAAGATATITVSAKVDATGAIANAASAAATSVDANSANNAASVNLTAR